MGIGWIIGIVIFVAIWVWLAYEIWTAPLMPDDYDLREEDIWPANEWPDPLDDEEHESFDEDHALDMVMNDMVKDFTEDDIKAIIKANENPPKPDPNLSKAVDKFIENNPK
jgi:hypothetical protein